MLTNETILTFSEAAKRLPLFNGKHPHASTVWRWARKGCKGVRLETLRLGSRFVTSIEALERFGRALAEADREHFDAKPAPVPKVPTSRQRQASIDQADRTLQRAGIV